MGSFAMEKFDKKCGDCRYYVQHYFKCDTRFIPIRGSGHCASIYLCKSIRPATASEYACTLWEPAVTDESKKRIEDCLLAPAKRLTEVAQILEELNR